MSLGITTGKKHTKRVIKHQLKRLGYLQGVPHRGHRQEPHTTLMTSNGWKHTDLITVEDCEHPIGTGVIILGTGEDREHKPIDLDETAITTTLDSLRSRVLSNPKRLTWAEGVWLDDSGRRVTERSLVIYPYSQSFQACLKAAIEAGRALNQHSVLVTDASTGLAYAALCFPNE